MFTCSKEYRDIPFAHRQPNHDGHCRLIHGHNWGFRFTFVATRRDINGFVIDFGKLRELKAELHHLDHALVLNTDDPEIPHLVESLHKRGLARLVSVPNASSEGLAEHFGQIADGIVDRMTDGRVHTWACTCLEDARNSATWFNPRVSPTGMVHES